MLKVNLDNSWPLLNRSINEIHHLFRTRQLSPSDLFEACRQRIRDTKMLNSFITCTDDLGLDQSSKSNERYLQGKPFGLLDGIPISIKDNFNTKNIRTTCASKMLENYHPPFNATVVEKLFDSGVTLMGKTNMDEFAMGSACSESYFGSAYHPWNSSLNCKFCLKSENPETITESKPVDDKNCWFITGGSSGGSAVSVATGTCFAALSSDTGGSTRNPASRLGIVGFKPSYGLISRFGLIPLTHSLDVPGIMARNVNDVRLVFTCLHGHDPRDSTTVAVEIEDCEHLDLNNLTIGIPVEYDVENLSPTISKAWKDAEHMLRDAGLRIERISLPHTGYSLACYSILNSSEVASNFACYDGIEYGYRTSKMDLNLEDLYITTREVALNDIVKSRIIAGNYFLLNQNYQKFFEKSLRIRRLITEDFVRAFQTVDFILTPVCITHTMNYQEWNRMDQTEEAIREDYCTQPANMAGLPAISLPFKLDSDNHHLPIGLQIIGRRFNDYLLLKFSEKFQQLAQFPHLIFE